MFHQLADIETANLMLILVAAATLVGFIAWQWYRTRTREMELAFKSEQMERGLTVPDVERLLAAGTAPPSKVATVFKGLVPIFAIIMLTQAFSSYTFWNRHSEDNKEAVMAMSPVRRVVVLQPNGKGEARINVEGCQAYEMNYHVTVFAHSETSAGDLKAEVVALKQHPDPTQPNQCVIKLTGGSTPGDFTVQVRGNGYKKRGDTLFIVQVRP